MTETIKTAKEELVEMLEKLTLMADKCIPSDDLSNQELAEADEIITQAHSLLYKIKSNSRPLL